ncbi:hypothetical protein [Insolitispirillum peregrinum]|uniref:hypothetical protein n=1 Tax=Insolitispirillum peregrinum TaxID=80876 RepID=UPI00360A5544
MRTPALWASLTLLLLTCGGAPAWAVDLANTDTTPYQVVIEENGEHFRFTIAPRAVLSGICSDCSVLLNNGQSVNAEDNDLITIKNGQMSVGG